eukprot:115711_1
MIPTCSNEKRCNYAYPLLWTSTYINTSNVNNVYLYVPRNDQRGTTKHSVTPIEFLSELDKYNIPIESLNVPSKCPTIDKQQLKQHYNLNDKQFQQAVETTKILWSILQSQIIKKKRSESIRTLHEKQINLEFNAYKKQIHTKLDILINCMGSEPLELSRLEEKNQELQYQLSQTANELKSAQQIIQDKENEIKLMKRNSLSIGTETKQSLNKLSINKLKVQYLIPNGLKLSGKKSFVIKRILAHLKHRKKKQMSDKRRNGL